MRRNELIDGKMLTLLPMILDYYGTSLIQMNPEITMFFKWESHNLQNKKSNTSTLPNTEILRNSPFKKFVAFFSVFIDHLYDGYS